MTILTLPKLERHLFAAADILRGIHELTERTGKRGGEFYTPRSIVRMIVRLVNRQAGKRVFMENDPCLDTPGNGRRAPLLRSDHHEPILQKAWRRDGRRSMTDAVCSLELTRHASAVLDANF